MSKLIICLKHNNESYIKYCKDCNINICFLCDMTHKTHKTISIMDLIHEIKMTNKKLIEIKNEVCEINKSRIKIIGKFRGLIMKTNKNYLINNKFTENNRMKNINNVILPKINKIKYNNHFTPKKTNYINNNYNSHKNYNIFFPLHYHIKNKNTKKKTIKKGIPKKIKIENNNNDNIIKNFISDINEITIRYNINNDKKIKIFGKAFVENNKDKCHIMIDGNKIDLCEYIDLSKDFKKQEILELKLIGIQKVINMSYMFYCCSSLKDLSDISEWNTQNVTDMSEMFYYCSSLISLPDISKWDTQNVTNMNYMFCHCDSFITLPDISKWNTQNVNKMYGMFSNCCLLKDIPDISKWNIQNVTNMKFMFFGCNLLKKIPEKFNK